MNELANMDKLLHAIRVHRCLLCPMETVQVASQRMCSCYIGCNILAIASRSNAIAELAGDGYEKIDVSAHELVL